MRKKRVLSEEQKLKSREYSAKWRANNKQQKRDYYLKTREKTLKRQKDKYKTETRDKNYRKNFNITLEEYDKMLFNQNNECAICRKPYRIVDIRLAVDHNHDTGKVRGLLCRGCNMMLGYAEDNIEYLDRAIRYLKLYND